MKLSDMPYPNSDDITNQICDFLVSSWKNGWFDSYSKDHFLIKAIENRLKSFIGEKQLIENNINQYNIVNNGMIDYTKFANNFCINLSTKLDDLKKNFGEEQIKEFVINQLSAGKENYNEDSFFEALSEISVLSFLSRINWDIYVYEPILNRDESKKNPEARFEIHSENYNFVVNVEVKSPAFPHTNHDNERIIIPTILLSSDGRKALKEYCYNNSLVYLDPRILKLRDFLNSASDKFLLPEEGEYNLLYINWSYRDFPSNSYLEAWSLLTNPINGILTNQLYANSVGVKSEFFDKISAVIVYTESIEGLMFQSFEYVWQRNISGPRFRMWINNNIYNEQKNHKFKSDLFAITGMNQSQSLEQYFMCDLKGEKYNLIDILKIIKENALLL